MYASEVTIRYITIKAMLQSGSGMFLTILIKLNTAYLKLRTGIVRKVKKNNIPSVHKYISTKKFSSIIYKESQYMR
jgi:hypothetical protein